MNATQLFDSDATDLAWLSAQWRVLAGRYTERGDESAAVFAWLVDHYSAAGRAYHNLSHVRALLTMCAETAADCADADAVRFAIWFHDCVYDTTRHDNEERSADLAERELARLSVSPETVAAVRAMILATKTHHADGGDAAMQWFLDLDLAILGSAPEIYRAYSAAIRREYEWVPELVYKRERRKVLERFLARGAIYFTDAAARKFEAAARLNLAAEIDELSR